MCAFALECKVKTEMSSFKCSWFNSKNSSYGNIKRSTILIKWHPIALKMTIAECKLNCVTREAEGEGREQAMMRINDFQMYSKYKISYLPLSKRKFFISMCCIHMVYGKAINVWEYGTDVTNIRDRQHQYKSIFDWCCWLSHRNLTSRKKREKDEHEHRKVGSPFIQLYTFFAYIVNWMWTLCVCELNK